MLAGVALASAPAGSAIRWVAIAAGALGAVVGAALAVAAGALRDLVRALPENAFGLCRGYDASESPRTPGLVSWLDAELDALAGREGAEAPLTFGDLWGALADGVPLPVEERRIDLQMITTNVTLGRPHTLPFEQRDFYFDPAELSAYFPPRVVAWLLARSGATATAADGRVVHALPLAGDLPVIVATRLSLSFPILISAVPLWSIDWGRPDNRSGGARVAERCWFSDGGICSNFPLHFFDSLMPRRPTFGVNLRPFSRFWPQQDDEARNVYMARTNGAGRAEWWNRFDEDARTGAAKPGHSRLFGFLLAIVDSAREWRDNSQARVPGYRDRVVHVKLDEAHEGGLNLTMPPEVVDRLTERGRQAGILLRHRYAELPPDPGVDVSWANHRWVRYRTAMAVIERMLVGVRRAFDQTAPGDASYRSLIERAPTATPASYPWTTAQRAAGPLDQTETLLDVLREWEQSGMDFTDGAPKPAPELRVTPRV